MRKHLQTRDRPPKTEQIQGTHGPPATRIHRDISF
jgi:hypothetical protein